MILRIALHISSFAYAADAQVFITTIQHIGLKGQRSFRTNCICVIFATSDMEEALECAIAEIASLRRCLKTDMIKADKENNIFGALKLIEQLYLDGEISGYVFRNILQEYKDNICIADFTCYKKEKQKGKNK